MPRNDHCTADWPGLDQSRPDLADVSTATLVRRAGDGDQGAWNTLVDRYTRLLWSVARSHRLGAADAADVVQTTWLRLVEHLGRIHDPDRLAGWLVTTARRECVRVRSRGVREVVGAVDDITGDLADAWTEPLDAGLLRDERDVTLWSCYRQLSERCQTLLRVLMAAPAPSYSDVSAALGMPVGAIGPTRGRCLDQLHKLAAVAGLAAPDIRVGPPARWA